ncbi:TPA: hypothetical protein N0F65_006678 [Lagenidium giganteum]|uniref:Uncharacterized protein n=1 Tax=Lagenidium giganteum TaxID=4803 RepID=A0AAV2Z836_9STRA|nr:TPA: hypothetical protein N0F65_006678 [Lagenidium giganteum]
MLAIQGTVSCALCNKRLAVSKTAQDGNPVPYVPEEWVTFEWKFICTHGWAEHDRGRGQMPCHHVQTTGCPFRFTIQIYDQHLLSFQRMCKRRKYEDFYDYFIKNWHRCKY